MTAKTDLVVLLDVDNTLLDNDLVRARLDAQLAGVLGPDDATRFWQIYEQVREDTEFVNFPETIQRFGRECDDTNSVNDVSAILYAFPFRDFVYAESFDAIRHVRSFATPVILSDGDQLFQRHKIRSAGIEEAVGGKVLVFVHKEHEIASIRRLFPADHYVLVDDKPRIHAAMKPQMGGELTTVMVCQGQYAHDPAHHALSEPDITIEGIADLLRFGREELIGAATPAAGPG